MIKAALLFVCAYSPHPVGFCDVRVARGERSKIIGSENKAGGCDIWRPITKLKPVFKSLLVNCDGGSSWNNHRLSEESTIIINNLSYTACKLAQEYSVQHQGGPIPKFRLKAQSSFSLAQPQMKRR